MKIRTKEQLIDLIDSDFAWRQKELTNLRNNVRTAPPKALATALRAAIVLLYAHWEGFIKSTAINYLIFVKTHKLKLNELDNCFLALAIKQRLNDFESNARSTAHVQFINFIFSSLDERAKINEENVIKTNSNLNFSTLRELLTTIGIDSTSFELKKNLIDEKLLHYRNTIAHGQYLPVEKEDFDTIYLGITSILNEIRTEIQNAILFDKFKK